MCCSSSAVRPKILLELGDGGSLQAWCGAVAQWQVNGSSSGLPAPEPIDKLAGQFRPPPSVEGCDVGEPQPSGKAKSSHEQDSQNIRTVTAFKVRNMFRRLVPCACMSGRRTPGSMMGSNSGKGSSGNRNSCDGACGYGVVIVYAYLVEAFALEGRLLVAMDKHLEKVRSAWHGGVRTIGMQSMSSGVALSCHGFGISTS